jgi:glycosyltransferase involved in cell wall biosynthesis
VLSIIVISKNNFDELYQTLYSIIPLKDFRPEIIVIAAGYSPIARRQLEIEFHYLFLRIYEDSGNGIAVAHNLGLNLATKRYCLFLNSGDRILDCEALTELLFRTKGRPWGYGSLVMEDLAQRRRIYSFKYSRFIHRLGLKFVPHPSTIIESDFARSLGGYDKTFVTASDHKLLLQFSKNCSPVVIKKPIAVFVLGGRSTRSENAIVKDAKIISRSVFGLFMKNESIDELIWFFVLLIRKFSKFIFKSRNFF